MLTGRFVCFRFLGHKLRSSRVWPTVVLRAVAVELCLALIAAAPCVAEEPAARVTIDVAATGRPVPRTLFGLFFEDINYAADGGLYAELVQNRSFEHGDALYAWAEVARGGAKGKLEVSDQSPLNGNNPHLLRIDVADPAGGEFGAINTGFDGIALSAGEGYWISLYARRPEDGKGSVVVRLEDPSGNQIAEHRFADLTSSWQRFEAEVTSPKSLADARLLVLVDGPGVVDVDMVSLFPKDTFKGRRNGLRCDLAQTLADAHPGFFRFPGGCIVEGQTLDNAYRWKDPIGDIAERKQNWNLWQNRESPQYNQTYGLGFFEYFQLAEDMGAENTLEAPNAVRPTESEISEIQAEFQHAVPPYTLQILRIPLTGPQRPSSATAAESVRRLASWVQ